MEILLSQHTCGLVGDAKQEMECSVLGGCVPSRINSMDGCEVEV